MTRNVLTSASCLVPGTISWYPVLHFFSLVTEEKRSCGLFASTVFGAVEEKTRVYSRGNSSLSSSHTWGGRHEMGERRLPQVLREWLSSELVTTGVRFPQNKIWRRHRSLVMSGLSVEIDTEVGLWAGSVSCVFQNFPDKHQKIVAWA